MRAEISKLKMEVKKYKGADVELKAARKAVMDMEEVRDKMRDEMEGLCGEVRQLKK